jgi:hypothetical protein
MAHHVETMPSQIVPLSNDTTISKDETASPTMAINTTCLVDIIILTVGCCLVIKIAVAIVAMFAMLVLPVSC